MGDLYGKGEDEGFEKSFPAWEWGPVERGKRAGITKGQEEPLGMMGYVHHIVYGDGFTGVDVRAYQVLLQIYAVYFMSAT